MKHPIILILCVMIGVSSQAISETLDSNTTWPYVVTVFDSAGIHFSPDSADVYRTAGNVPGDNGRTISTSVALPALAVPVQIKGHLRIHPVPKNERDVFDRWDRAGNVRLLREGRPDIEVAKFITSYGGYTEHEVDLSHLAPLLTGDCDFTAFVDTWVSPAFFIDFEIEYRLRPEVYGPVEDPIWGESVFYLESYNAKEYGESGLTTEIEIPAGMDRVILSYLVSGHCSDGRGADEFISKDNVIAVDNTVVYRFRPWRDDCRKFREVNPYCARWTDGYWSSDFSRTNWCPGDVVTPIDIDLSDHLMPGGHTVKLVIEDVRPADADGNHGYWRVSAYVTGWARRPFVEER